MGGCGNQRQAEGTCFREPVDEIEGGTGGRWKEQVGRERRGYWTRKGNRCER